MVQLLKLGLGNKFNTTIYQACDYLLMLESELIHIGKLGPVSTHMQKITYHCFS